jgi:hypothetical protein
VQVVVQQSGGRGVAVLVGVEGVGEFGGVGAQQVVEDVPAGDVFGEQTRPGQLGQQPPGLRFRVGGEVGGGGGVDVWAGV